MIDYNDDYPTCERTYAMLRVYDVPADRISRLIGIVPTKTQVASVGAPGVASRPHGWFLSSDGLIDSRDVRRHLDWCLDQLQSKAGVLDKIRGEGGRIDIFCYWLSASGDGGPMISPSQARKLSALALECGFDVYLLNRS